MFELPNTNVSHNDNSPKQVYTSLAGVAPQALTMDRMGERSDLIVAQSTSQFCRCLCFQPSINWIVSEEDNYTPGVNPFDLTRTSGWIHEESSLCHRTFSHFGPGCRETTFVQHAGQPPQVLVDTERAGMARFCCRIQTALIPDGLSEEDRCDNVVATHEKRQTCGYYVRLGNCAFPCCFDLPYLETKDDQGRTLGSTRYVCDGCLFVPKFDTFDARGEQRYRIRPDTCCLGACVLPRCGGGGGRCLRVPYIIRDPATHEALPLANQETVQYSNTDKKARMDVLWSGLANECCAKRSAYHLAFPAGATREDKLTLMGSSILLDVTMYEQTNDDK